ncbi:hypothetical protein AB0M72_03545 [Nocardiopsis dassonvillei]
MVAETPIQHFRAPQEVWEAGKARAAREGRTLPKVLNRLLSAYVDGEIVVDIEGRIAILNPEQRRQLGNG